MDALVRRVQSLDMKRVILKVLEKWSNRNIYIDRDRFVRDSRRGTRDGCPRGRRY